MRHSSRNLELMAYLWLLDVASDMDVEQEDEQEEVGRYVCDGRKKPKATGAIDAGTAGLEIGPFRIRLVTADSR